MSLFDLFDPFVERPAGAAWACLASGHLWILSSFPGHQPEQHRCLECGATREDLASHSQSGEAKQPHSLW